MDIESYETLLKGLFNHEKIEYLDLQNNELGDKYGNMISRIITRQGQRRDQIIWSYGLRNEVPSNKFVIQTGRTLSINKAAIPNVKTTIRDDFLFSINSSR